MENKNPETIFDRKRFESNLREDIKIHLSQHYTSKDKVREVLDETIKQSLKDIENLGRETEDENDLKEIINQALKDIRERLL